MSYNYSYGVTFTGNYLAGEAFQSFHQDLYNVRFATDETRTAFSRLRESGVTSFRGLSVGFDTATREIEANSNRILMSTRGVVFGFQMALFYATMFASGMNRTENAQISLDRAERNYAKTIREHGRGSEEARNALESLTMAQNNYNTAVNSSNIMNAAMVLQGTSMVVSFIQLATSLQGTKIALDAYNASLAVTKMLQTGLIAGLGSTWLPLAVGLAGLGIGAGLYYGMQGQQQPQTNVNVRTYDEDILKAYLKRTGANEAQISGAG